MWDRKPDALLWGYQDDEGNWAVGPVYEMALPFYPEARGLVNKTVSRSQ